MALGLLDAETREDRVTAVVVLAGQRDGLHPRLAACQVLSNLLAILDTVHAYDDQIACVICTIPRCRADEAGEVSRAEINQGLRARAAPSGAGGVLLLDITDMAALAEPDAWSAEDSGGCSLSAQGNTVVAQAALRLLSADPLPKNSSIATTNITVFPLCSASASLGGSLNITTNVYASGQWVLTPPSPSAKPTNKSFECCEKSLYTHAAPGVCAVTATQRERVNEGKPHQVLQCGDGCCGELRARPR